MKSTTLSILLSAIALLPLSAVRADVTPSTGWLVPAMSAKTVNGQTVDLRQEARRAHGLVVAFTSTTCPVSRQYGPTLARLEKELSRQKIRLVLVNPTATDTADSIKTFLADFPADQPYVHDRDEALTKALGARSTTEAFLIDSAGTVAYRGAVDDQFTVGTALDKPRHTWLVSATLAMLKGEKPDPALTDPAGCVLDVAEKPVATTEITYHNRISRIIQQNCLECHHEGGLAPFSLESLDDLKAHKAMIRREVARGQMPPWFAAPATMKGHPGWSN